jgi:alkylation response protein AidB-like acyl-CoA dehydrogenase
MPVEPRLREMNIDWTPDDLAFRDEVRAFLSEKLPPEIARAGRMMTSVYSDHEAGMEWQRLLHERGWAAPHWPVEHGGQNWSMAQHYLFTYERVAAGAPPVSSMGIHMVAHVIAHYGTPEQKSYFLPRILTGEVFFCQGYSEPDAGSDLASLQMAALEDGDDFVCNGSKIWTTHATEANWIFCLVRTSRETRPQEGITFLLIDMNASGITVRPLTMISGEAVQSQVFFDDVRVPKANVIGAIGSGWTVAKHLLEFERGNAYAPGLKVRAATLAGFLASAPADDGGVLIDDPLMAAKLAGIQIRIDVLEMLEFRLIAETGESKSVGALSSMLKVMGTELAQALSEVALDAAGPQGGVFQPHATVPGSPNAGYTPPVDGYVAGEPWQALAPLRYLNERAGSIYAGSNEIQRNILAKLVLGL